MRSMLSFYHTRAGRYTRATRTFILAVVLCVSSASAKFIFCCNEDNDLYRAVPAGQSPRAASPDEALERAQANDAMLILADGYPQKRTDLPRDFYARAIQKHVRLYVEYPSQFNGDALTEKPRTITWERGVVTSDLFGASLPKLRILALQDCRFIPARATSSHLVISRVAGYDTAVYGVAKDQTPLLFEINDGQTLIAATKLSNFITARYAPSADWKLIWQTILHRLDPDSKVELEIDPMVRPALGASDLAPPMFERETFDRAAAFYAHARLLITKERQAEIHRLLASSTEGVDAPKEDVEGDGSLGMIEGYASRIRIDGSQEQRTPIRSDCNAEAAMVLALARDEKSQKVAGNLLDYVFGPEMQSMGRLDPKHPAFGLIAWGAISPAWMIGNYGDDDARVILSTILASASLKTDRWNEHVMRSLLANLRTTGTLGFRGDRVDIGPLEQNGWKHFHDAATVNPAPHFESYLWACNLWARRATGEIEFLDKAAKGIRRTMAEYENGRWRWMDNIERARMLLCLSWMVRLQDTEEHRHWLTMIATDLLEAQQPCGAIQERRGQTGADFQVPQSNEAYGTGETPLIQQAGDPVADQLYTTGFALLALHEAVGATGDEKLKTAEGKLADFLCRVQIRSEKIPYLDGGWFRAFDYKRWDYWASSADVGWGAWCVEAGWGQAWIAATLALRERHTTFWEMTADSKIKNELEKVQGLMTQNDGSPLKR